MTIGDRIRKRREQLNLSQDELAKRMGYTSRSTINKIESGVNDITQSKVVVFANVLDTTVAYLMGWNDTISDETLILSPHEKELVTAYRNKPDFIKHSVNKLLDLMYEEPTSPLEPQSYEITSDLHRELKSINNFSKSKNKK